MQAHVAAVAEQRDRPIERRPHVADIAAERQQCFSHDPGGVRAMVTPTSAKVAAIGACGLCTVTRTAETWEKRSSTASATAPAAASTSR